MRQIGSTMLVWWFITVSPGGTFGPTLIMQLGPYDTEEQCIAVSNAVKAEVNDPKRLKVLRCREVKACSCNAK